MVPSVENYRINSTMVFATAILLLSGLLSVSAQDGLTVRQRRNVIAVEPLSVASETHQQRKEQSSMYEEFAAPKLSRKRNMAALSRSSVTVESPSGPSVNVESVTTPITNEDVKLASGYKFDRYLEELFAFDMSSCMSLSMSFSMSMSL